MTGDDQDVMETVERGQSEVRTGRNGRPGLLRVLWADLRRQELPREPTEEELAWMAEEEERRRQAEEAAARAPTMSDAHLERMRRRYAQS